MEGVKLFIINSKDRLAHSASSTDCIFQFSALNATSAEVVSFQMPMTTYNINSKNNVVYFNDGIDRTFTMTPGNYSVYDLIDALQTDFNTVSSGYLVTYSDISMKITITGTIPFQLTFGTNTTNTMAYILGFNNVNTTTALVHVSNNCINLSLPLYLCCDIDEFSSNSKSTNDSTSVFVFPNKVNGGDLLSFSELTDYKQCAVISEPNVQNLNVRFSFPGNYDLDLNGNDWQMVLRLHYCKC